jgi:hypothetical protein
MGEHEATGVLRQMPRCPDQFPGETDRKLEPPILQVEIELFGMLRLDAFFRPTPHL